MCLNETDTRSLIIGYNNSIMSCDGICVELVLF